MTEFRLRFQARHLAHWADAYEYADDGEVVAIGKSANKRGWYTKEEFARVCLWKTARTRSRVAKNEPPVVEEVTALALNSKSERIRIGVLRLLHGVEWPTASVLLHLGHSEPYPILDYRALWSCHVEASSTYGFPLWWGYSQFCRALRNKSGLSMRRVDRALWQYSKEHQG